MGHVVAMDGVTLFLPQEIITNILSFLPVKSLIKFQCVCKPWKNLIKTPSFIAAHLHHSTQLRPRLLLHRHLNDNCLQLYFLDCKMQIVKVPNFPVVDRQLQIVGSSNGLLCLRIDDSGSISPPCSYLLWNPAFREVRHVPLTFPDFHCAFHCDVHGFGFSPIVNDYKIVSLYQALDDGDIQNHLAVYSLGTGSWKQIKVEILRGISFRYGVVGFTMNGSIFWHGYKHNWWQNSGRVIISFDIAMEEFALMPMPSVGLDLSRTIHITEFEQRLALLCSPRTQNYKSCWIEMWVWEKGIGGSGERWSWVKKYTSSYLCLLTPITIWRNEIVCLRLQPKRSQLVGIVMSNFSNTEMNVLSDEAHLSYNYVESLIPVSNIYVKES
ncbi:hypothetical protein K1719_015991 [Acacia pycnantha]|nr:hypothetical protein K1719_015991 [Acacia pycnantha]